MKEGFVMKILAIGDVYGKHGCDFLLKNLSKIKRQYNIDLVIANGENSAEGNGILPGSAETLFAAGVDVVTGGNHSLRRKEIFTTLEENPFLLRPANLPNAVPGKGIAYVDMGYTTVAIINLLGVVYLENMACPFETVDKLVLDAKENGAKIIVVDVHAEATSEKRALGFYLDGRVSCVFGTHTHIQTADEQILPNGTGYITDVGMTGVYDSILGVDKNIIIQKMKDKMPVKFYGAVGDVELNGCIFDVDKSTGLTNSVERIKFR
jgi:metallophosphoesterase (TIGR00282 family)